MMVYNLLEYRSNYSDITSKFIVCSTFEADIADAIDFKGSVSRLRQFVTT